MQKKLNNGLRDLLNRKKAKPRKLSKFSKTEQNRLAKLNLMLDEPRRGKNVQDRRLAKWLTEEEYESFESDWESQQQIREELQDKPSELQRYEDKLKEAIMMQKRSLAQSLLPKQKSSNSLFRKQANPLRTTQFELLSNPPLLKSRYPINKSVNKRLENTH